MARRRRPVLGVDYVIMGLAPSITWLFVGRTLSGMAGASFIPAYAYLADITPPEKRAQSASPTFRYSSWAPTAPTS
jgi:MFS family permease